MGMMFIATLLEGDSKSMPATLYGEVISAEGTTRAAALAALKKKYGAALVEKHLVRFEVRS